MKRCFRQRFTMPAMAVAMIAGAFLAFSAVSALAYGVQELNDTPGAMPLDPWTVVGEPPAPLPGWESGALVRQDEWIKYGRRPYAFVATAQRRYDPALTPVRPLATPSRARAPKAPTAQTSPAYVAPRVQQPSVQTPSAAQTKPTASTQTTAGSSGTTASSGTASSGAANQNTARTNPYTGAAQEVGATSAGGSNGPSQGGAQAPAPSLAPAPSPRPAGGGTASRTTNVVLPDNNGRAALQIPPPKN